MGLIQSIIRFILSLFGIKTGNEPRALDAGERAELRQRAVSGLDDVEGAENIRVVGEGDGSRVVRSVKGAVLIQDEDGTQVWSSKWDTEQPRASWQDEWGPITSSGNKRMEDFFYHESAFNLLHMGDPIAAEKKVQEFGYRDVGHFFQVRLTVTKHYATFSGPLLQDGVFQSQEVMSAMMAAGQRSHQANMQATSAANPELLAPIEGVTAETYAQIAARQAQGLSQDQFLALLAQHGLDRAKYDRVAAGWNDRMSKDTTATIATIYGNAFTGSGQGQFGAAGQAAVATGWTGQAAGGKEPFSFERYCEIQGAMSAWSKTGQDVNALLKKHFNMVAGDWSTASMWWNTQMMADLSLYEKQAAISARYEAKYSGPQVKHDQDIAF